MSQAREGWRGFCEDGNKSVVTSGISSTTKVQQSFPRCLVTVFVHGGAKAVIFADNNNTPLANPFQANLDGSWIFYADDGRYDILTTLTLTTGTLSFTYLDVLLCDPFVPGSVCAGATTGNTHNLLSTTHLDTIPASPPVRGDIITAQNLTSPTGVSPAWSRLPLGSTNNVLTSNGLDAVWAPLSAVGGSITINNSTCTLGSSCNSGHHGLEFTIYNGGTALNSGTTVASFALMAAIPFACTIDGFSLAADQGTATVKFWKVATGTAIPTSGNSINTSGVSLSTGTKVDSVTLTDFTTTAIAKNDSIIMDIFAVAGGMTYLDGVLSCHE